MPDHAGTVEPLLATCWTTAGDAAPLRGDGRSPLPLRARVEAAAQAGFRGFGLVHVDLQLAKAEMGLSGISALLDDNGIEYREVELLEDWWTEGPARRASDRVRRDLLEAAEAIGARTIKIGPDFPEDAGTWDARVSALADLGREAAEHGTRAALEFLPWSNVPDVRAGLALVEAASHPAVGLLVDAWHVGRAGTAVGDLAALPADRIFGVELNDFDARSRGTLFEDTRDRRRYCGEGVFDVVGMIRALRSAGFSGPWGVEILSDEHRGTDMPKAVTKALDTAVAALRRAGTG